MAEEKHFPFNTKFSSVTPAALNQFATIWRYRVSRSRTEGIALLEPIILKPKLLKNRLFIAFSTFVQ